MALAKTKDERIDDLYAIIQEKKEEISKAEKPNWITKGLFKYSKNSVEILNIQTITDVNVFISALAFLIDREKSFNEATKRLGIDVDFNWFGYSLEDWTEDFKTRVSKLKITTTKKELEVFEKNLNKLVSPERRELMKLDKITQGLSEMK